MPKIKAVCLSQEKGPKSEAQGIRLIKDVGVEGDFHATGGDRQVSLVAAESIKKILDKGLPLTNGAFGENVITEGIDLRSLKIGQRMLLGEAEVEIAGIGKECIERCLIYFQTGDCIMPREGVFARVLKSGRVGPGDHVEVIS